MLFDILRHFLHSQMEGEAKEAFLRWLEFRTVPDKLFLELNDFTGDAFQHMFICMTSIYQREFSIAAKHLRNAITKDRSAIGRMAEIGALQVTSMLMFKKRLMAVLDSYELELVLKKFADGPV